MRSREESGFGAGSERHSAAASSSSVAYYPVKGKDSVTPTGEEKKSDNNYCKTVC